MADEAHRGQYGLTEKVVVKQKENGDLEAKTIIGTARIIRDSLSNATYIGFTGTPISSKDRSTREVFGDYIDIYDTTQTVEDGATRPVYYESRVIHLKLDENTLHLIDTEYDIMAQNADPYVIEKSKKELGQMEAILGADQTIDSLVSDILDHYENYRANILTGKAMIVAYSRPIAMKIYKRILELRPAWTEKVGVVMTQGNNDLEEWREIIGNKAHKDDLAKKFKDNSSPMKIAIVVDMWLTGFDVPSLATMYVYKPMDQVSREAIEAAKSFGASTFQIIWHVILVEAIPGISSVICFSAVAALNASTTAGMVGAGGLGNVAIRYGYNNFNDTIMYSTVAILVILVQLIQFIGNKIYNKLK